ncbi:A-kinase anchor protein 4, partial [Ophiophagus hannah]
MAQEIDWLNSQAGLCPVDLYRHDLPRDENCEMVCFIDVATLSLKDKDQFKAKKTTSQSSIVSMSSNDFDLALENLEEKNVIVIKDNERNNAVNTVCLFKQGSLEEANIVNWLSNDLQKYAAGFQQALSNFNLASKSKPPFHASIAEKIFQSTNSSFQDSETNLVMLPEFGRGGLTHS